MRPEAVKQIGKVACGSFFFLYGAGRVFYKEQSGDTADRNDGAEDHEEIAVRQLSRLREAAHAHDRAERDRAHHREHGFHQRPLFGGGNVGHPRLKRRVVARGPHKGHEDIHNDHEPYRGGEDHHLVAQPEQPRHVFFGDEAEHAGNDPP